MFHNHVKLINKKNYNIIIKNKDRLGNLVECLYGVIDKKLFTNFSKISLTKSIYDWWTNFPDNHVEKHFNKQNDWLWNL